MLEYIAFLSCLEFALLNSVDQGIILKPKQVLCLESVYLQNDVCFANGLWKVANLSSFANAVVR